MVNLSLKGDFEQARALHYSLVDVTDMLFAEGNPGGIKEVLKLAGGMNGNRKTHYQCTSFKDTGNEQVRQRHNV